MSVEEPSSSTPSYSSVNPPLSREDVAIGSVTQHAMTRTVSPVTPVETTVSTNQQPFETGVQSEPTHIDVSVFQRNASQDNSVQVPTQTYVQPVPVPVEPPQQPQQSNSPTTSGTSSSSTRLKVLLPALSGIAFVVFCGAFAGFIHWHAKRNNPNTVFNDALYASLSTKQLEEQTHAGALYNIADYDFTNMNNPVVSTQSTMSDNGSMFQLAGYGTAKNTYISYMKFPSSITSNITSEVTNGWVQIRSNGLLPKNASQSLDNVADPRYQDIGLLSFGNFNQETRTQLVNYINSEHIYSFQSDKVTHATLNNQQVLAYPVSINMGFLKVYDESIATDQGFSPNDVASAVNDLGNWNNAKATFYVSEDLHRFVAIDLQQGGKDTRLTFTNYNNDSLPQEPVTNLNWQEFAPVQQMIDQEASVHQSPSKIGIRTAAMAIPIS